VCSQASVSAERAKPSELLGEHPRAIELPACTKGFSTRMFLGFLDPLGRSSSIRMFQTVDAATVWPSRASSPWILRCPHRLFSFASRETSWRIATGVAGRPGVVRRAV
jgi:hypothetical protein